MKCIPHTRPTAYKFKILKQSNCSMPKTLLHKLPNECST